MSFKNLAKEALTYGWSLGGMRRDTAGCRVLMYHSIELPVDYDPNGSYTVSLSDFKEQMTWLRNESGLKIVSANEGLNDGTVAITFDDGYFSFLECALPVLHELNIPSTVFVTTSFVRENNNQFLTPSHIHTLSQGGHVTIGSHSVTHPFLGKCTDKEIERELGDSKRFLEDICGSSIELLAYPNGSFSKSVIKKACAAGYSRAFSSRNSAAQRYEDRYSLPRTCILGKDGLRGFKGRVYGHYDWHGLLLG